MYLFPAEQERLIQIEAARAEFRQHWASIPHMPYACVFDGDTQDIKALDYLDYEGLKYPASDVEGAALIWGGVLAARAGLTWVMSYRGDLLLTLDSPGNRVTIWPFARVLESRERSQPQDGRYEWLLTQAAQELLQFGDLSAEAEAWAHKLVHGGFAEMERRAQAPKRLQ